jgi:hypothetical protein
VAGLVVEEVSVLEAPEAVAHLRVMDGQVVTILTPIDQDPTPGPDHLLHAVTVVARSRTDLDPERLPGAEVDEEVPTTIVVVMVSDVAVPAMTAIVSVAALIVRIGLTDD